MPKVAAMSEHLANVVRNMLADNMSMSAIARQLYISTRDVKKVRDELAGIAMPPKKLTRHEAEMYVLSRVGKCTDAFAEVEREAYSGLEPVSYARDMTRTLAKVSVHVPIKERN
jgi:hypothetical protein